MARANDLDDAASIFATVETEISAILRCIQTANSLTVGKEMTAGGGAGR